MQEIGAGEQQAPVFHYDLKRHIHLDEDFHAPLSLRLLNALCADSEKNQARAIEAAKLAVSERLRFRDGVLVAVHQNNMKRAETGT